MELSALREAEDKAILGALEMQRQVGIDVFTDGEYRRSHYYSDMLDSVEGFVPTGEVPYEWRGPGAEKAGPRQGRSVGAKLRQKRRLTKHELPFLKEHAPGPFKVTVTTANQFARGYRSGLTDRFYATRGDLALELADILHRELEWLIAEGAPYVQIDAPGYTRYLDERARQQMRKRGVDPDQELEEEIAVDNASLAGLRRQGAVIAMHMCRGNSQSRWLSEGSYEPVAEKLFGSINVGRFLLEYDTSRAGGFEPLRFMPRDKEVVLGLVTTKEGRLESVDHLLRRIDEASKYVSLDNLALSPQCGFASSVPGNLLSLDDQCRKLQLVVEVARRVWKF
jgi:5-methyltetrahydropteroyltriglutamate--homocysteine methyltransferase